MIIIILKILGLSYLITHFEPIKWIFDLLEIKFSNNILFNILYLMMSCLKCTSFWIGLIMCGLYVGIICFIISFIYEKNFSNWEKRIKF